MNLLDFAYLENNLDTKNLYGCDTCIANLFLLQKQYNIQLYLYNNILIRHYSGKENNTGYGFPLFLKSNTNQNLLKDAITHILGVSKANNQVPTFCFITDKQKESINSCLSEFFPDYHIVWNSNQDDSDYLYIRENLSNLSGKKYQKKRNHISQFNRKYGTNWYFKSFPENDISQDILFIENQWLNEKIQIANNRNLLLEKQSIEKAVEYAKLFHIQGGVLYVNNKPVAMTLASPISNEVLDILYEKSFDEFERNGAYAVINQQFAQSCNSFKLFNREEDLGIEGLRKAKLSYHPDIILNKYFGSIIKN